MFLKIIYCIAPPLVQSLTLWCILKLLSVSKFMEHIIGAKNKETVPEDNKNSEKLAGKNKSKLKGTKTRQRIKQPYEEPAFSTNLLTPIEDILEETITEETKPEVVQPFIPKKKGRKNYKTQLSKQESEDKSKSTPSQKNKEVKDEDSIGYSFFKPRIPDDPKSAKELKKKGGDVKIIENEEPIDEVGYSFLPVKEKAKKNKNKSFLENKDDKETLKLEVKHTTKKNKEELSKPSIIDHYKARGRKEAVLEPVPAVTKKFSNNLEKVQHFVDGNRLEEKFQLENQYRIEYKESKKVCSNISYASIVNNKLSEENSNSDINSVDARDIGSRNNSENRLVTDSSENEGDILTEIKEDYQTLETSDLSEIRAFTDKTSIITNRVEANFIPKSNSSSIEVLSETEPEKLENNNIHYQTIDNKPDPFEIIEKNINKLVGTDSDFIQLPESSYSFTIETTVDSSKSSSISLIGNQTELKEALVVKDKLPGSTLANEPFSSEIEKSDSKVTSLFESVNQFISVEKHSEEYNDNISPKYEATQEKVTYINSLGEESISKQYQKDFQPSEPTFEFVEEAKQFLNNSTIDIFSKSTETNKTSNSSNLVSTFKQCSYKTEIVESQALRESLNIPENHHYSTSQSSENTSSIKDNFNLIGYTSAPNISSGSTKPSSENNLENGYYSESQVLVEKTNVTNKCNIKENSNNFTSTLLKAPAECKFIKIKGSLENNQKLASDLAENSSIKNKIEHPKPSNSHITEIQKGIDSSSKLIAEEKCVKKFAYVTGGIENKKKSPENNYSSLGDIESQILGEALVDNKKLKMGTMQQIRVLTLNDQAHQECTLYRIEKNWAIQFRLGPSLFGRKVYLYCNYPAESNKKLSKFNRNRYQLLQWELDDGCKNADDTAAYTQITAKVAGSFHYYFTYENGTSGERQGSGYFLVDPILKYGNNEDLPLDCIQCQTVLTKGLGSVSTWEKKLQVAKESGYNMIHFTPIQELGDSNSSYSLSEQLKLNPVFKKENGEMPTFEDIEKLISKIRDEWKITSICDIVLNHTANESEWIKDHPEVSYNCVNCPYMRPAYLLDAAIHQFSLDIKKGLYEDKGIPPEINNEDHLNAIRYHFRTSVLDPLNIPELYICDVNKCLAEFLRMARTVPPTTLDFKDNLEELDVEQDPEFRRLAGQINMDLALKSFNVYWTDTFDEDSRIKRCAGEFKKKLDSLNNAIIEEVNGNLNAAVENIIAGIRYFRVQGDGPRVQGITINNPLVYRYFTDHGHPKSLKEHEEVMYSDNGRFLMAHNGWVMNSDPLKNFAGSDSNVYIRRELIAWGDSVKLRFGDKPEDCPFLWDYMRKYVEQTAKIFDGVRLDNCHSTPIPVAEYLLDCARNIRPDLYVVAELFTNSDMTDNIFVNRLGITSLIREAMSAWDSHEEGRLVHRYGGYPVGSFYQPRIRPLVPSVAHALFLDLTHDNPSPVEKRSVFDLLPSTALVNMACCASGSNRGYDELVPHHIHVVDETRQYTEWTEDENLASDNSRYVTKTSGIIAAKKAINSLHFILGKEGYNQVYVDQIDPDIVAVTRHCPEVHQSYILVAFTAFGHPNEDAGNYQRGIKPLRVEGIVEEIVLEATLNHTSIKSGGSKYAKFEKHAKDSKWINGLSEYRASLKEHIQVIESDVFEKVDSGSTNITQLNFKNFKPGSIVVVRVSLPVVMKDAVKKVRNLIDQFSITKETELSAIVDKMSLADLNRAIYRCDQEERDEGFGFSTYNIPNFESMVYAGLQGFMSLLANIRPNNDLGHPMCANLRDGNWMIDYIWKRLKLDEGTRDLGKWIEDNTKCFSDIPRYLVPCYFDVLVTGIYVLLMEKCYKTMSSLVKNGSTFVRGLSLGSVQFGAYIKSADLPTLSPNLAPPKPPTRKNDNGETVQACITLSAGLPHFTVGYMRNWGRDTFIALRGAFILTGRYEEARQHILGYAACLRHGLIPNLLDGGRNSRFNCRDAVWWWLYCIKEYAEEVPNGLSILDDKVSRIFPTDDSPAQPAGVVDQPLCEVIQEALRVHFQGLAFRERNAGRQIDEHMTDRGFNNQIGVHPETGFVFGGNEWNCGTWMDKMGSSDKAGNRGKPATPRDGSAVELIGLSKAVVTWLWKLNQENKYPHSGVERTHKNGTVTEWTFKEWSDRIQANFEKYFWVNTTPVPDEIRPDLVNKRGIYKDSYGASQEWTDFQLRCNFPIVMVVAPELFNSQHAWIALKQAEEHLVGPLGMKTLDPADWAYRGNYDNSNDSDDPTVSHGFNYHQGPEWVWPIGFFLRAKLHFSAQNGALKETLASTKLILSKHFTELQTSPWRGLPELTNSNGSYCKDSSRTQAWSMTCILEVLHDLQKIESSQTTVVN